MLGERFIFRRMRTAGFIPTNGGEILRERHVGKLAPRHRNGLVHDCASLLVGAPIINACRPVSCYHDAHCLDARELHPGAGWYKGKASWLGWPAWRSHPHSNGVVCIAYA